MALTAATLYCIHSVFLIFALGMLLDIENIYFFKVILLGKTAIIL